jgi:hypothetical protein
MALKMPKIDDADFQQLLAEALARVRVHTPEWTNLSESDPGVTILELFAYLTESLLYRSNQIPERNRIKFLSLLGRKLQPAMPARGAVTFANSRGQLAVMALPAGTPLSAGQLPFVTATDLALLPVETALFVNQPVNVADLPAEQLRAIRAAYPDGNIQIQPYAAVQLPAPVPQAPLPRVPISETLDQSLWVALLLRAHDYTPAHADCLDTVRSMISGKQLSLAIVPTFTAQAVALPPAGGDTQPADSPLMAWCGQTALTTMATADVLAVPGVVQIRLPDQAALTNSVLAGNPPHLGDPGQSRRLLGWVRVAVAPGVGSADAFVLAWAGANAAMVSQQVPVDAERLGRGTGQADQAVTLIHASALPDTVRLAVGGTLWQQVADLMSAAPEVPVRDTRYPPGLERQPLVPAQAYTLDPATGAIKFGDGAHGTRPAHGAEIRASYAYGGGSAGNVGIGAINKGPYLPPAVTVSNPVPTWGGDDAETVQEAEQSIPAFLQTRDRMVTVADFEALVVATPGVAVGRVEALPLFNPTVGWGIPWPGSVCLLVIPQSGSSTTPPEPDRRFLSQVAAQIEPRRLLTTEIWVRGPAYKHLQIAVALQVVPGYAPYAVHQAVGQAFQRYLSPLTGGPEGTGWPLNTPVTVAALRVSADRVDGVAAVRRLDLTDMDGLSCDSLPMVGLELPWLDKVEPVVDDSGNGDGTTVTIPGPPVTVYVPVRMPG